MIFFKWAIFLREYAIISQNIPKIHNFLIKVRQILCKIQIGNAAFPFGAIKLKIGAREGGGEIYVLAQKRGKITLW